MKYLIWFTFAIVLSLVYTSNTLAQDASHDLVLTIEGWSLIELDNTEILMSLNNSSETSETDNSTQLTWGTNSTSQNKITVTSEAHSYQITVLPTGISKAAITGGNGGSEKTTPVPVDATGNDLINDITQGGGTTQLSYDFSTSSIYEAPVTDDRITVTYELTAQ